MTDQEKVNYINGIYDNLKGLPFISLVCHNEGVKISTSGTTEDYFQMIMAASEISPHIAFAIRAAASYLQTKESLNIRDN